MTRPEIIGEWQRETIPPEIRQRLAAMGEPGVRAYTLPVHDGLLRVFIALATGVQDDNPRWHLSIAHSGDIPRLPTWEELRNARYTFMPHDITVAMLLPPPAEYINEHEFCFHLWQTDQNGYTLPKSVS